MRLRVSFGSALPTDIPCPLWWFRLVKTSPTMNACPCPGCHFVRMNILALRHPSRLCIHTPD